MDQPNPPSAPAPADTPPHPDSGPPLAPRPSGSSFQPPGLTRLLVLFSQPYLRCPGLAALPQGPQAVASYFKPQPLRVPRGCLGPWQPARELVIGTWGAWSLRPESGLGVMALSQMARGMGTEKATEKEAFSLEPQLGR